MCQCATVFALPDERPPVTQKCLALTWVIRRNPGAGHADVVPEIQVLVPCNIMIIAVHWQHPGLEDVLGNAVDKSGGS